MSTTRYRERDQLIHTYCTPQQYDLAHEWIRLNADPATSAVIRRWARSHQVFEGAECPADIVKLIDQGKPDVRDRFLVGLIELFHAGQQLAGRILLQAMLPKLSAFAFRSSVTSRVDNRRDERLQLVLCEFWEVLTAYPIERRRERVAANLALDTLHRLTEVSGSAEVPMDPDRINLLAPAVADAEAVPGSEVSNEWSLDDLLDWAVRREVVSSADARLLAEVYSETPEGRGSFRDVSDAYRSHAARTGVNPAALRQRTHRAKRRLATAVNAALAPGPRGGLHDHRRTSCVTVGVA